MKAIAERTVFKAIDFNGDGGGTPLPTIFKLTQKLRKGVYKTVPHKCFCGADNDVTLRNFDRHGIPNRSVICMNCGLIRNDPVLDETSMQAFYEKEYREIYDYSDDSTRERTTNEKFLAHIMEGFTFYEFVEYFDIPKDVIVDIGCHMGGFLKQFQLTGSEVHGVDYDLTGVEYGKTEGIDIKHGGIEEMIKAGVKADIVVLNHVLEHVVDLEEMLEKCKQIMKPEGVLFIGVPGLYFWGEVGRTNMFQNAHVWQFTADTLEYVMNCCGFDDIYLDERVFSLWRVCESKRDKKHSPKNAIKVITDWLSGEGKQRLPLMRTITKFNSKQRKENIDRILSCKRKDIRQVENDSKEGIVIAGGPSIKDYPEKIKELQANGGKIFTIERMYQWCHKQGITPDYVVVLDASDDVVESFAEIHEGSKFLVSTQANPDVMDILKDEDVYIFSGVHKDLNQHDYWHKYGYDKVRVINGGGSVALCAMSLAFAIGCRNIHIFGFDCHTTNDYYADGITGEGVKRTDMEVKVDDRVFKTSPAFVSFMQQFFILYNIAKHNGLLDDVRIYGDSFVKAVSKIDIDGDK